MTVSWYNFNERYGFDLNKVPGIYMILNMIDGKKYIGKSNDIGRRWREHSKKTTKHSHIDRAINKYGKENFNLFLLERVDDLSKLNEKEKFYIHETNAEEDINYYNHSAGGDGFEPGEKNPMFNKKGEDCINYGRKHTAKAKKKMSENHVDYTGYNHPKCKWDILDEKGGICYLKECKNKGMSRREVSVELNLSEEVIYSYLSFHETSWSELSNVREAIAGYNNGRCRWGEIENAGGLNHIRQCIVDGKTKSETCSLLNVSVKCLDNFFKSRNTSWSLLKDELNGGKLT